MTTDTFNTLLSFGTLILQLAFLGSVFAYCIAPKGKYLKFLEKHAILFGFLMALVGIASSLFYSNVIGYAPCELCWLQRIALYPLAVIFGAELFHKEKGHALWWSGLILSLAGLAVSSYQYVATQFFPTALACAASEVSCAKIYFISFGYITIPMMALTSFAAIAFLLLVSRPERK